eukprot:s345_g30.t1
MFEVTKKEPKGGVSYLLKSTPVTVLGSSEEQGQVHVDVDHELQLPATVEVADMVVPIISQEEQVLTLEGEWLIQEGIPAEISKHAVIPMQVQDQLAQFWKQRWWKDPLPGPEEYTPKAARGPDGLSHPDLLRLPEAFQEELVGILNSCETQTKWPEVNEFPPVIIYSTVYRSWRSLRAQRFLRFLASQVDETQLGVMPGREVAEVWMLLQGLVEHSAQTDEVLAGFVTDLRKAFDSHHETQSLSWHITLAYIPPKPIQLWKVFLEGTDAS